MKTFTRVTATVLIVLQLTSCGLILYPEREGQAKTGRIDPTVAILDGVGCLFFLIPGLIAFAVDFHEGTIYLPPSESAASDWRPVKVADGRLTREQIERAVHEQTGREVALADPRMEAYRVNGVADLPVAAMH
jgi:hypothetical protein